MEGGRQGCTSALVWRRVSRNSRQLSATALARPGQRRIASATHCPLTDWCPAGFEARAVQTRALAISRLSLWTVPTPSPVSFAVLPIPRPFASSRRACSIWCGSAPGRPSRSAHLAGVRLELPVALDFGPDGIEAGAHPLPDHRPLEFRERTRNLEKQLARRRGRVEVLLIEVEVDTDCLEILDGA